MMQRIGRPASDYRTFVGPAWDYDRSAALQFSLLAALGLRDQNHVLDIGCGSLRLGRLLIPFLQPERYFGIEPNRWLVDDGIDRELGRSILDVKRPAFRHNDDFDCGGF